MIFIICMLLFSWYVAGVIILAVIDKDGRILEWMIKGDNLAHNMASFFVIYTFPYWVWKYYHPKTEKKSKEEV